MDVRCNLPIAAIENLSYGICIQAMKKGLGVQLGYDKIYYGYVYIVQAFLQAALGTFPTLQQAPVWFWNICEGLRPKTSRFKTGTINYRWESTVDTDYIPPQKKDMGGYTSFISVPDPSAGNTTNGFPNINPALIAAYTPELGEKAIQLIFDAFPQSGITKKVPWQESFLSKDVSAFAMAYQEFGTSLDNSGGLSTTVQNECFIECPILSKFARYQDGEYFRGQWELRKNAAGAMYVIPRALEFATPEDFRNKQSPIIKPYNFDEFFEVLSLTLANAMQIRSATLGETVVPCPLTPQRVQILLRQSILNQFANDKCMDLFINGLGSISWQPFVTSSNGVSQTLLASANMRVPQFFAENVRACSRKVVPLNTDGTLVLDHLPVLGRFPELPQLGNYQYQPADGSPPVNVYATDGGELPISLVDGATPIISPSNWVSFDGQQIMDLVNIWNGWIEDYGSFLTGLTAVSSEGGISALSTVSLTDHTNYQPLGSLISTGSGVTALGSAFPTVVKSTSKVQPTGVTKTDPVTGVVTSSNGKNLGTVVKKVGISNPDPLPESAAFQSAKMVQTTSMYTLHSPIWKFQKLMIHPCGFGITGFEQAVPFQQTLYVEPCKISYSSYDASNTTMMSLYDKHLAMSKLDARSRLAPPSEMQVEFDELAKKGKGGLFTGLAGTIGGLLGIPGSKEFMNGVSDATGGWL